MKITDTIASCRQLLAITLSTLLLVGAGGCSTDGPMENAGEAIDNAGDNIGDAVSDAADEVEDAVD